MPPAMTSVLGRAPGAASPDREGCIMRSRQKVRCMRLGGVAMAKRTIRALLACAIGALFAIGLSGTADAKCNCFCKVTTDLGSSPGPSISNFLIQYSGLPSFANCTVGVPGKKQTCSKACSDATANDSAQYGNDQWLCSKLGANFNGKIVAYSAIGTHNYDSAAERNLDCRPPPPTPQTLAICASEGQTVTINLSTGVGAIGSKDLNWTVTGGGTAPAAYSTNKVSTWVNPPTPSTHWIQPSTLGQADDSLAAGSYVYTTTFVVPTVMYLLGGITVQGTFSADNSAVLMLNNVPVANCPGATCFAAAQPFTATNVKPGLNILQVTVTNNERATGLMVDASVVSNCTRCTH